MAKLKTLPMYRAASKDTIENGIIPLLSVTNCKFKIKYFLIKSK